MAQTTRRRSPIRVGVALLSGLALGAGGLLLGFALTAVAGAVLTAGLGIELTAAATIVLGLVFVQGVGCAAVALTYSRTRPRIAAAVRSALGVGEGGEFRIGLSTPSAKQLVVVVVGYLAALGGAFVGSLLVSALQVDTGTNNAAQIGMENPAVLLLLIPASILIIGPGEELLFRGVVQGRLREVMGAVPAVGIASTVFAGLHWFAISGGSPTGNLVALGVLTVPALVFGIAYEFTDNVVVPSLIHGLYNATLFSLLYLSIVFADEIEEMSNAALGTAF